METWTHKYAPSSIEHISGQENLVEQMRSYLKDHRGRSLLVWGPPGSGKTSMVYAFADELGYDVNEVNASDARSEKSMQASLGMSLGQQSLIASRRLILIDDVDGISGTYDRGGIPSLVKMIERSTHPIVCTAIDISHKKMKPLIKKSMVVELPALSNGAVVRRLKHICHQEDVEASDDDLKVLARKSGGDLRAAINDLQALCMDGKLSKEEIQDVGDRKQTQAIIQALTRVFKTTQADLALGAYDEINEDLDTIFSWVEYNMPTEYTKTDDLARAFADIAYADVFRGRIRRWQYYRFYVHCYELLSAGVALAKEEKYISAPKYKQSSRPLMIWMAKQRTHRLRQVALKVAERTHISQSAAFKEVIPFLKAMYKKPQESISEWLDLTDDEIEALKK